MTVAALKRSTLYAIVPWGLQRSQSRQRRGGSAVPSMRIRTPGCSTAPKCAASLRPPRQFRPGTVFICAFRVCFSLPALNFTQLPSCRAAAQHAGVPSTGSEPTWNQRHASIPQGTGREEHSGGTHPWLLPIFLSSIPQQLEVHFHQLVTATRRCALIAGCASDRTIHSQPCGSPHLLPATAPTSTEPLWHCSPIWPPQAATLGQTHTAEHHLWTLKDAHKLGLSPQKVPAPPEMPSLHSPMQNRGVCSSEPPLWEVT